MRDRFLIRIIKRIAEARYRADLKVTRAIKGLSGEPRFSLRGSCKSCGKCCETPMIQVHPVFFRLDSTRRLIISWHRVINGFEYIGEDRKNSTFIFRCIHYDPQTTRCDSYRSRPGLCRDYPRNLLFTIEPDFFNECGHHAVVRNAESFLKSLESLDLPPDRIEKLKDKLHLRD